MDGTILAANADETSGDLTPTHDCSGTINSSDYNLVGITDNCALQLAVGRPNRDILPNPYEPMLNNLSGGLGQPTQTHVPKSGESGGQLEPDM